MEVTWTESQKKVIDLRKRNILVSAAAGSGKTAVLVERILHKIMEDKADIDKMLIVTFTNAAAAEMRERIRDAIEAELERNPSKEHLQKQFTLVHNAQITTIDSFCLYVIRNYFHKIDLEPNFRVADEGELALLRSDVLDHVLESYYQAAEEPFLRFIDGYGSAKNDNAIREMILKLYAYSQSYPWPEEWLASCQKVYEITDTDAMGHSVWMESLLKSVHALVSDCLRQMQEALALCEETDGPYMYADAVKEDIRNLMQISDALDYEVMSQAVNDYTVAFPKLAAARKFEGSSEKKDRVQNTRNNMKKILKDIRDKYFFKAPQDLLSDLEKTAPMAEMLLTLTKSFSAAFAEEKKNKNLLDFSDMEHFALKILVDEKTKEPTETADEFARLFDEIMIDEYQDSNYVQETILKAVSKERFGQNNMFMVGDVKQSIYRFRLARPELFMEKFDTYDTRDSDCQRIDLHKNFRSRAEVLEGVNDIFYKIMDRDLGNVVYDEKAALYAGASYPQASDQEMPGDSVFSLFSMEVMIADESENMAVENKVTEDLDRQELEALMIADRIKSMIKTGYVTDKKTGELRRAEYRDIVILLRSVTGQADTFVNILMQEGIPAFTPSKAGYFSTVEIQTVLNMLRILDNPMQDIPLAAVLHSPIGGFSGEELAVLRAEAKNKTFYESILGVMKEKAAEGEEGSESLAQLHMNKTLTERQGTSDSPQQCPNIDEQLIQRLRGFLQQLEDFRSRVPYTPVHELIGQILEETGYLDYITALPAGEQKRANVQMLIERAIHYEDTSYKGLFHFVRYIEKLHKYNVDYGEADIVNENENAVRIMSIHKSKGLEFPIVFAAGMGRNFNMQDTKSRLILHPDLGIGMDYMDAQKRTRTPTLLKRVLAKQTDEENRGEELRVLYVALTRAKEKLILTGCMKNPAEELEKYKEKSAADGPLSFLSRNSAGSYFDWVIPALYSYGEKYQITICRKSDLRKHQVAEAVKNLLNKEQIRQLSEMADAAVFDEIAKRLSFTYPFEQEKDIKTKVSVSEIKHQRMQFEEEEIHTVQWYAEDETEEIVPDFIEKQSEGNQGALRGSAMHLVMQCIPFQDVPWEEGEKQSMKNWLEEELESIKSAGRLDETMYQLVRIPMIETFFASSLAKRMIKAEKRGELFKEKAFVLGIPAGEIWDCDSKELVLVQGIVDAFFYEEDEIVIMDYKTDSVKKPEQLIKRYQAQLDLYAKALTEATGKKVKEKIIYSFHLKQEIPLI